MTVDTQTTVDGEIVPESHVLDFTYDASGNPQTMTCDGVTYYYSVNIQGDVMAILDENGAIMVHYIRQGYGLGYYIVPSNATGSMLNKLNPFGYRGYVRDRETYLYYLESRYYSEDLCRFLNADAYTSTGQGLLGNNMFAYCLNNPTNYIDTSGRLAGLLRDICRWIDDNVVQPVVEFVEDVYEDIKNFDLNNQSEEKVLESNYFSCYKGVLVIRTNGERSGSFGVIFLTRESNNRLESEDVVRHEYGHTRQFAQLDVLTYALCIGLPSWQNWGTGDYYSKPWEITADILGGVESRQHSQSDFDKGFAYLEDVEKYGILAWFLD